MSMTKENAELRAEVGPEAAVGDQGVDVRLPVLERAVGPDVQSDAY